MLRFKNKLDACHHYRPGGEADSILVDSGQVVETAGTVASEIDDAYLVENNGQVRAWPKVRWELEAPAAKSRKADAKPSGEELPA